MTTKQKILRLIQQLDEGVSCDEVIDKINLLKKIEIGIQQADRGEGMEHDEFMKQLMSENAEDENNLDAVGARRPASH